MRLERHGLVALAPLEPVVFVLEGDAPLVAADQAAVRDGDTVGVAGEIGEHRLGSGEGFFGVDHPVSVVPWREVSGEGIRLGQMCQIVEEVQAPGLVGSGELLQEQSLEQFR